MRPLALIGVLLVIVGIVCLAVPSFTYFTRETADVGFFAVSVDRPQTIVLNPIVGIVSVVAGLVMIMAGRRSNA